MVNFKWFKKFGKKDEQSELSDNPKQEFEEDHFDVYDFDPKFEEYVEEQSTLEWLYSWTEWVYYKLDEWVGWSSWRFSFRPEKDLTPAERKAYDARRKAESRRKQLESDKLRRNQQLRNQILDEKRTVQREEQKCLDWKKITETMLDQKLSEAKNVFFDPDSDYLADARWRMKQLDKKAVHQNLCELLLCVEETSCSSPLGSSFETEIKRPSMTPASTKISQSTKIAESFVSFQKEQELLQTQEKLLRVQEALKETTEYYKQCLSAYHDLFGTCESKDYNYNPDYSNPSVSLSLPGFREEREEGNSNSNPNRPKTKEEFNSDGDPDRETGRFWKDVGRNLLTLPVFLLQHPEILNLTAKSGKPLLNGISAIVHLSLSVVVLVFYIGVTVILMSVIISMVNIAFARIRLAQARYRRNLELAYQEIEQERTKVRGSKAKYVEGESDIDSEDTNSGEYVWVPKRKKKSTQFWERKLGWLAKKLFTERGGALVPLSTVDMYSVTESDRQFILWQVGPERHIIQLEKQMRELLTRVEKDLLPELTRVENELLQEMTQVEKEDDPSKKWKDRFRFFQFLKLKKRPRLSSPTLSTILGVVVFFGLLTSLEPIHSVNQMDLQTDQPITSVLKERQVELEESLVENFKDEESLVLQQRQTSGRRRERKWNRKIRTLKDLPPLEEGDFGEEIPEENAKLSSFAKRKKIKIID